MTEFGNALQAVLNGATELPQAGGPAPQRPITGAPPPMAAQQALSSASALPDAPAPRKTNMGLLVGVAFAFLVAGVAIAVVVMKVIAK